MTELESLKFNLGMGYKVYTDYDNYYDDFSHVTVNFLTSGKVRVECHYGFGGDNDPYDFSFEFEELENVFEVLGDFGFGFVEFEYGCVEGGMKFQHYNN